MSNYKPFSTQFNECKSTGNLIKVDITKYGVEWPKEVLVCIKYKTACSSKVCIEDRVGNKQES